MSDEAPIVVLGRYAICDVIGAGGMATVHLGRLLGPVGFSRTVAIKRMHAHLATDPEFVTMFLDEARLAAQVQHANVVSTLDVVSEGKELFLVMEYIAGESFARVLRALQKKGARLPLPVIGAVISQALYGLHAVHEARADDGTSLGLVHRDVSPDNILVGRDGLSRLLDFGIAKATERGFRTQAGKIKGKVAYMAPEQLRGETLDRRVDVYATSALLWEALVGRRLYGSDNDAENITKLLTGQPVSPPSSVTSGLPSGADELVLRGLSSDRNERFATAREMAQEVERVFGVASPANVGQLIEGMLGAELERKAKLVDSVAKRTAEISSSDLREARGSVLAKPQSPNQDAGRAPFKPLNPPEETASPTAPSGSMTPKGTDILVLPNLELPSNAKEKEIALPRLELERTMQSVGAPPLPPPPAAPSPVDAKSPAERPANGGASLTLEPREPAKPKEQSELRPATSPPQPAVPQLETKPLEGRLAPKVAAGRAMAPMRFEVDRPEPELDRRSLRPLLLPLLLIVLVLGLGAGFMIIRRAPPPAPSARSASVGVADPQACEALRRRVRGGGQALGLSRDGWVAELWLKPREGEPIDPQAIDLLALTGSDPASRSEIDTLSARDRPTNEGVLIRLAGPVVTQAFEIEGAGRLTKAADRAFESSKARAGALYLKCAHLPVHDVGLWFRGRDLPNAGASLLFALGSFGDVAMIRPDALYPPGTAPGPTLFDDLDDRLRKGKVAELQPELERYGGTVQEDGTGGFRITFAIDNAGSGMRAARVVADLARIESR